MDLYRDVESLQFLTYMTFPRNVKNSLAEAHPYIYEPLRKREAEIILERAVKRERQAYPQLNIILMSLPPENEHHRIRRAT